VFWTSNVATDTQNNISNNLNAVSRSSWLTALLREYGVSYVPGTAITITPVVATGTTVNDSQAQQELNKQIDLGNLPGKNGGDYLYLLFFPPGVTPQYGGRNLCQPDATGSYYCAYHNAVTSRVSGSYLTYAVIPDHSKGDCSTHWCADSNVTNSYDAMTTGLFHEISEALTDPDTSAGFRVRNASDKCPGCEIGDICQSESASITDSIYGTVIAQMIWSNRENRCVQSPGVLSDANADGHSDLWLAGGTGWTTMPTAWSNGNGTYYGTNFGETSGDNSFASQAQFSQIKFIAGDVDGDGHSDLVEAGGTQGTLIMGTIPVAFMSKNADGYSGTNLGVTSGDATGFYQSCSGNNHIVGGDFDGDGRVDIVAHQLASGSSWPVAFSNGDGTWREVSVPLSGNWQIVQDSSAHLVTGDFNGDGLDDIAMIGGGNSTTIPVLFAVMNGSSLSFNVTNFGVIYGDTNIPLYATNSGAKAVAGDFNGDGLSDIALTGAQGWTTIPIAFSLGDGHFQGTNNTVTSGDTQFTLYATNSTARPVSGDFDGDGVGDIALVGGTGWTTMPIAFGSALTLGTFRGTNGGETSGDRGFSADAQNQTAQSVCW
jgi:hypothetical protein